MCVSGAVINRHFDKAQRGNTVPRIQVPDNRLKSGLFKKGLVDAQDEQRARSCNIQQGLKRARPRCPDVKVSAETTAP